MRIIVTGSEGLIGKPLCEHLSHQHEVIRFDLSLGHDLTRETLTAELFKHNQADYLVNLFAIDDKVCDEQRPTLFDVSLANFAHIMNTNVTSLYSVCREFARNNEVGGIVNFSSIYGMVSPIPSLYDGHKSPAYCISKSAVIGLTKYLAVHLAPNINVNCLVPSGVAHMQNEKFVTAYNSHIPIRRMMEVNELFGVVDFLCSDQSNYMTGSVLVIDGGWTSW